MSEKCQVNYSAREKIRHHRHRRISNTVRRQCSLENEIKCSIKDIFPNKKVCRSFHLHIDFEENSTPSSVFPAFEQRRTTCSSNKPKEGFLETLIESTKQGCIHKRKVIARLFSTIISVFPIFRTATHSL